MNPMEKTMTMQPTINLKTSAIAIISILLILGGLFFALNKINDTRNAAIYNQYSSELNPFIAQNRNTIERLFETGLTCDQSYGCNDNPAKQILAELPDKLTNYSSTAFIKLDAGQTTFVILRLSGGIVKYPVQVQDEDHRLLLNLLKGNVNMIPPGRYLYIFRDNEVFIPVANQQGKVIGAIVRGVIE